jgi:glycosyltransferase involved in cell wall biosynthesis
MGDNLHRNELELTILMPCLNEAETIGICIRKARGYIEHSGIPGEVLIADNGSTDGSREIALELGAKVVSVPEKGYGSALISGINSARGEYIIMGDADDSYDFSNLDPFIQELQRGGDLVMGNRFKGGIRKNAMPFLHKKLGNPVLSFIGRLFFDIKIGDFHCGLRGFKAEKIRSLNLKTTGMEFASEMIVKARFFNLNIVEVPTVLYPDGRSRPPHLKTWRDGWRHLVFLLIYSPRWLFLYPGLFMFLCCSVLFGVLQFSRLKVGRVYFDIHSLIIVGFGIIVSFQIILFAVFSKVFSTNYGLIPERENYKIWYKYFNLERGIISGLLLLIMGIVILFSSLLYWKNLQFGEVKNISSTFREVILGSVLSTLGVQIIFSSFMFRIIGIESKKINIHA